MLTLTENLSTLKKQKAAETQEIDLETVQAIAPAIALAIDLEAIADQMAPAKDEAKKVTEEQIKLIH
jgi:hypothetical protein